jgi:flagellar motor switch protein FliG
MLMADLKLDGKKKAAIIVAALGPKALKGVFSHLSDDDIQQITLEVAGLGTVDAETRAAVVEEFRNMAQAREFLVTGGMDYARTLLEGTVGEEKAVEILSRLQGMLQRVPFEFMQKADPAQICNFIQEEHPQTIALILAHLDHATAATILASLPEEERAEVVIRIATMDRTAPEVVREVERVLERKIATVFTQGATFAGGIKDVAEVLIRTERGIEKSIFSELEERDPELADEIKKLMFVFDDLVLVDDAGIQKSLREIDNKDLALALKMSTPEVQEKIFRNMSQRARTLIQEEMEFMGPVRLRSVEEAQQKIVTVIRRLEEAGEVLIAGRGGEEDEIIV